jgi:glucose/arabinose dehydrogenase
MRRLVPACLVAALFAAPICLAAPYDDMDYGPFISATFVAPIPKNNLSQRGIAIHFEARLPGDQITETKAGKKTVKLDPGRCGIIFDTELLRYSAGWSGGFINYTGVVFDGGHGANPSPRGTIAFGTTASPGWGHDGDLNDPRPIPHGPLPRDWARYKGLYRSDKGIVFSYTVGDCAVLDMPTVEAIDSTRVFGRSLNVKPTKQALIAVLADVEGGKGRSQGSVVVVEKGDAVTIVRAVNLPPAAVLDVQDSGRILLRLPALNQDAHVKLLLWSGPKADQEAAQAALAKVNDAPNLTPLTKGGKALWNQTVTAPGKRAKDDAPYVVDSIPVPFQNPYKSWMRLGGFDFFSDGRAAVCTWSGDVWIVSGIDGDLAKVTWKRYAAGLFQALGLKVVDDKVYVLGRDQITRLHDLNGDGEADFYECFNNDVMITKNFHEFIFDLQTDAQGNFYFVRGGPVRPGGSGWDKIVPHHGCLFKVSRDGSTLEVVARGFRAPNGMGVGPAGEITCGDNEGTWTPTCPINWIKPGGFYGVPEFAGKDPKMAIRDNPLCWLPHHDPSIDNSNGGQAWVSTTAAFGPLTGQLLHTSYGTCTLFEVLKEEVDGQMQGGVVPLLRFDSGVNRLRFRTEDNALYLTGLRGWQTSAARDAGFYRVRYTGKKAAMPVDLHVTPGTIRITFSAALDRAYAEDTDNYNLQQWNYRWTQSYGSPHFKVSDPKKQGHDDVEVQSASLSPDGRTVTLMIETLQPVMQMKIAYNLKGADGAKVQNAIYNTINVLGDRRAELHVGEFRVVPNSRK